MCDTCTEQYRLMSQEFDDAMNDYQKERADGTVRGTIEERVHDLAMLMAKSNLPTYVAWMAAVGFEHLAALKERGVEINAHT